MKSLQVLLAIGAVAALAGPALGQSNTMNNMKNAMTNTLTATMGQQHSSKQTGTVSIKNVGGGVLVAVTLSNEPKGASEPSHIHKGTCAKLNPAPWKPLHDIVNGKSTTVVKGITVAELKKAHYAVNVHKSAADLATYVSCGDL